MGRRDAGGEMRQVNVNGAIVDVPADEPAPDDALPVVTVTGRRPWTWQWFVLVLAVGAVLLYRPRRKRKRPGTE